MLLIKGLLVLRYNNRKVNCLDDVCLHIALPLICIWCVSKVETYEISSLEIMV